MKGCLNKIVKVLSLGVAASTLSSVSLADPDGGFTVTPMAGWLDFDDNSNYRDLQEDFIPSIGLGYRFASPWQLELVYSAAEFDRDSGGELDYQTLHLDALYHLKDDAKIIPYLAAGLGYAEFDGDNFSAQDEANFNVGGGLKIPLGSSFALRPDVRAYHDFDDKNIDLAYTLGLQWLIGGSNNAPAAPVVESVAADSDGDGVPDSMDVCASTPAGVEVDTDGCAKDDDDDGVPNHLDNCPGSELGAKVDTQGCYVTLEESVQIKLDVKFGNNSPHILPEYLEEIEKLATFMRRYPETSVVIEGHSDSSGSDAYNKTLSERRAASIARLLVAEHKVSPSRVSSVGYGEERPIADNSTSEGRQLNRRVVAVVETKVTKRAE